MWNKMADSKQVFRDEDDRRAFLLNIFGNQNQLDDDNEF